MEIKKDLDVLLNELTPLYGINIQLFVWAQTTIDNVPRISHVVVSFAGLSDEFARDIIRSINKVTPILMIQIGCNNCGKFYRIRDIDEFIKKS